MEGHRTAVLRSRRHTRRTAFAAAATLLALAGTALAFAADTTSASVSIEARNEKTLYTLGDGTTLPTGVGALRYTTDVTREGTIYRLTQPRWTPAPGQLGAIEQGGDLFVVDARGAASAVVVDLHITNLAEIANAYSALLLPIGIWRRTSDGWSRLTGERLFLTHTNGSIVLTLPAGSVYDLTVDAGGTWAAQATPAGRYAPELYAVARRT